MNYLINFTLLGLIYILFFYKRWKKGPKRTFILASIMYAYIVMVLYVTLMPFTIPFMSGTNNLFLDSVNLIPFRDLKMNYYGAQREIRLNIIMMLPFGFLFPMIKKSGFLKTTFTTFLFSLTIETSQLLGTYFGGLSSRAFDVTDLITNTLGGFIGYILFRIFKPIIYRFLKE